MIIWNINTLRLYIRFVYKALYFFFFFHVFKINFGKVFCILNLNLRNYSKVDRQHFDLVKLNFNQRRAICCINVSLIGESSSLHIFLVVQKAMAPAVSRHILF